MPMVYLAYSFVERKYYTLPEVAAGLGIDPEKIEEAKGELYDELVHSVDSEKLHSRGCITSVWDDLKQAQKNTKRHLKEVHREAKRAKKDSYKEIEHTSKHRWDEWDVPREDDL